MLIGEELGRHEADLVLQRGNFTRPVVRRVACFDAERQFGEARLGLVRARAQRYLDTAQLFVAMGGGWWEWREAQR